MGFGELIKDITTLLSEANKFDKNTQQKNFLKELRNISRKISKQEKTQRMHLILGIILSSIASGILGYVLTDDGRENFLILVGYIPENKVYNESTYKSYSGGFFLTRPGTSWHFGSMKNLENLTDVKVWEHPLFIDGQILENSSTTILMSVWVFSEEYTPKVPLEIPYAETTEKLNSKLNVIEDSGIMESKFGDWVERNFTIKVDDRQQLNKHSIKIHDGKMYVIQSVLWDPEKASDKDKQDFDIVWDSFNFCSTSVNCGD